MKPNHTSAAELIVQLPVENEWLALEAIPATNSSYVRVIAGDGTELAYRPILLDSCDSWEILRHTLEIGSSVSQYIELPTPTRFRALLQSHVEGVAAYDFESVICVLQNGTEISIDECEIIRRQLANHIGVAILPVPSRSQRSVDLAIQLIRMSPDAFSIGGPLARARLHRRLTGLETRRVTVFFGDGGSESGVVERTKEFLPRYLLRNGVHTRIVDPAARILMVDLTGEIEAAGQEVV